MHGLEKPPGARDTSTRNTEHPEEVLDLRSAPLLLPSTRRFKEDQAVNHTGLYEAIAVGNQNLVQRALDAGLSVDLRTEDGSSLLHCAARAGQTAMVQFLLAIGVPPHVKNERKISPLDEAILSGNPETVACLLGVFKAESIVEEASTTHRRLANCGSIHILRICLAHVGTDIDPLFPYKVLNAASVGGQLLVVRAIVSSHRMFTDPTSTKLCEENDLDIVPTELQLPWPPNATDVVCFTPLHNAAAKGHTEIVRLLLDQSLKFPLVGRHRKTPLHLAAHRGHVDVVDLLLGLADININCREGSDRTPLHLAAKGGSSKVVQALLAHPQINAYCADSCGSTPLQYSALYGHWDTAQILLNHQERAMSNCDPVSMKTQTQVVPSDIMSKLLQHVDFRDINIYRTDYLTPRCGEGLLHLAVRMGDCDLLRILCGQVNININLASAYRCGSPLDLAAELNQIEAAKILLQHKDIDINLSHPKSWIYKEETALQTARRMGHGSLVDLLLAHGARDDDAPISL